ncbi:MAG TPA: RDD family protein [Pseudonocardiaceae bacterium]
MPRDARACQGRAAGIVSRGLAGCIDIGVLFAMMVAAYVGWAALLFVINPPAFRPPVVPHPLAVVGGSVLLVGYLTISWITTGRTYGDQVFGLRVLDRHGRVPHLGLALARAALCTVFLLGLLWVVFSPQRRSIQDVLLRTSVVYDWHCS